MFIWVKTQINVTQALWLDFLFIFVHLFGIFWICLFASIVVSVDIEENAFLLSFLIIFYRNLFLLVSIVSFISWSLWPNKKTFICLEEKKQPAKQMVIYKFWMTRVDLSLFIYTTYQALAALAVPLVHTRSSDRARVQVSMRSAAEQVHDAHSVSINSIVRIAFLNSRRPAIISELVWCGLFLLLLLFWSVLVK